MAGRQTPGNPRRLRRTGQARRRTTDGHSPTLIRRKANPTASCDEASTTSAAEAIYRRETANSIPLPATAADVQAARIYVAEIAADSQEIGAYTAGIAAYIVEIGTYMKEIAGYSLATRIAFMEPSPDWSEIATCTPGTGNYRTKMAGNALETAARSRADPKLSRASARALHRPCAPIRMRHDTRQASGDGHRGVVGGYQGLSDLESNRWHPFRSAWGQVYWMFARLRALHPGFRSKTIAIANRRASTESSPVPGGFPLLDLPKDSLR